MSFSGTYSNNMEGGKVAGVGMAMTGPSILWKNLNATIFLFIYHL